MSEILLFPAMVIAANVIVLTGIVGYFIYCKTMACKDN